MCVLNRDTSPKPVTFDWSVEAVDDDVAERKTSFDRITYRLRDVWAKEAVGTTENPLSAAVPGHDVLMIRLTPM